MTVKSSDWGSAFVFATSDSTGMPATSKTKVLTTHWITATEEIHPIGSTHMLGYTSCQVVHQMLARGRAC